MKHKELPFQIDTRIYEGLIFQWRPRKDIVIPEKNKILQRDKPKMPPIQLSKYQQKFDNTLSIITEYKDIANDSLIEHVTIAWNIILITWKHGYIQNVIDMLIKLLYFLIHVHSIKELSITIWVCTFALYRIEKLFVSHGIIFHKEFMEYLLSCSTYPDTSKTSLIDSLLEASYLTNLAIPKLIGLLNDDQLLTEKYEILEERIYTPPLIPFHECFDLVYREPATNKMIYSMAVFAILSLDSTRKELASTKVDISFVNNRNPDLMVLKFLLNQYSKTKCWNDFELVWTPFQFCIKYSREKLYYPERSLFLYKQLSNILQF